jgi:hypothetical protein
MPKVLFTNDGIRDSVIRPVVLDITRQLQEWTGLGALPILFPGDSEVVAQPASTMDESQGFNQVSTRPMWRVNLREEHLTDKLLATAVHQMEFPEYFYDESLMVYLRPVYSPVVLTMEFEYRSTDANNARRWRDEIRSRVSTNRDIRTHIINYHFPIPQEFFPLLEHIWTLRETQAGYGDTFDKYLTDHFTQNVTKIATQIGTEERWAVAEQQGRVTGQWEFQDLPDEPSKQGNDGEAFRQAFSYKIFFDCPIATAGDYPVLIHNQLIDEKYLMYQPKDDFQTFESRSPRSLTALGAFEVDRLAKPTIRSGIRLPEFHEFYPRSVPKATLQVLSALVGVAVNPDGTNNRTIMNFNEIDEKWEFRPEFIAFLKHEYQWLNKYCESFVNVTVYDNHMPLHHSLFHVDADLNVILDFEPDLRRTYYVRLSIVMDPSYLTPRARDSSRDDANGLTLIGAALCPDLVKYKKLPQTLGNTNYITRAEGEKFFTRIRQCTQTTNTGHLSDHTSIQWNTVMIFFIETYDRNRVNVAEV